MSAPMSVSLSAIESSVLWIRAVGSPSCCPNAVGHILCALLVAHRAQVLLNAAHGIYGEHYCLAFVTLFAELVHLVETSVAQTLWLSDPARETRGLQPERDGRVGRCSALFDANVFCLGHMWSPHNLDECSKHDRVKHNADERGKQLQHPDTSPRLRNEGQ